MKLIDQASTDEWNSVAFLLEHNGIAYLRHGQHRWSIVLGDCIEIPLGKEACHNLEGLYRIMILRMAFSPNDLQRHLQYEFICCPIMKGSQDEVS